jgi:hypothetical protein
MNAPKTVEIPEPGVILLKYKVVAGTPSFDGFQVWKLIPPALGPPG